MGTPLRCPAFGAVRAAVRFPATHVPRVRTRNLHGCLCVGCHDCAIIGAAPAATCALGEQPPTVVQPIGAGPRVLCRRLRLAGSAACHGPRARTPIAVGRIRGWRRVHRSGRVRQIAAAGTQGRARPPLMRCAGGAAARASWAARRLLTWRRPPQDPGIPRNPHSGMSFDIPVAGFPSYTGQHDCIPSSAPIGIGRCWPR